MADLDSSIKLVLGVILFASFLIALVGMLKMTLIMIRLQKENAALYKDLGSPSIWRSNSISYMRVVKKLRYSSEELSVAVSKKFRETQNR